MAVGAGVRVGVALADGVGLDEDGALTDGDERIVPVADGDGVTATGAQAATATATTRRDRANGERIFESKLYVRSSAP